jgi:beta-glucosidase
VTDKLDTYRPLALAAAHQGITLLTNVNGTLPMSFRHKNILVVGSLANDESSHTGGYTNGGAHVVTTWEAVQSVCNATEGCSAELAQGASPDSFDTSGIAPAVDGVQKADFVIAVVGDSENTAGENRDVDDLDLNGAQLPLLWAVCEAARSRAVPVVAVVISAQPKTFGAGLWTPAGLGKPNALVAELGAILAAWRPGEEGGTAVRLALT